MKLPRVHLGVASIILTAALVGCGNYRVTFEVADYINAWGDPQTTKQKLDIDIVCLGKEEAEKFPAIANGTMRSDEWFKLRDEDSGVVTQIKTSRFFSLRSESRNLRGKRLGDPLLSYVDYEDKKRERRYDGVKFSDFLDSGSVMVVYGRFFDKNGVAKTAPVLITPAPRWDTNLVIKVGKSELTWVKKD